VLVVRRLWRLLSDGINDNQLAGFLAGFVFGYVVGTLLGMWQWLVWR
jgi:tetrahydromethanopterin S-methyltransferase subunit F